ncbi:corticotropin-releasing factor receptor 2-like [Carassius auratus]|uniref:Corticotropin-releasing factor receptor 2-like n=1 Tax=Carassius auratus TaxID=7957 RepID=A0A6P6JSC3_CARAU|nr:corticotropin-releasing factor receptor 2-like [Carassius auratus]XP_052404664.1 corticotropin-releasing factor receptor 2 [Carassius gibelio]
MDASLFQFFIEEFGDANCTLMDAFQDTLYENSSFASMSVDGLYCNATTDEIGTCWPRSNSGQIIERPCPEYINGVKYNTTRIAYRECLDNGTWALKSNYSNCEPILEEKRKYPMHYKIALIINYFGHCISVGALIIAFILFLCLRSIRCLRNIIHWNLITTFILRNVMWFLLQLIDENIYETNEPWCRLITTIYNYFVVTNFFWMFVEGCYLHTAIVMTYSTDKLRKWVFLFIGWCIPCPIIIVWAIGKLYNENEQCWFGKEPGKYIDYIYQGPVILVLLINFVFLFNIVRILMTKLRASTTSETIQYRKAVKATLVLLPLLGITYMLFFVNPGEDDISQIVFIYFNSFLQSFQGFFVSVFYCFLNGEVRSAARKRWHRWQDNHALRIRVARAMSIPTSPTRISFHSIKQTTAV